MKKKYFVLFLRGKIFFFFIDCKNLKKYKNHQFLKININSYF